MVYALNDKIKIERPIVFLCGPYYKSGDVSDRRRILNKVLLDEYKCLPLIIDNFLTPDNIGDDTISIQLLEEIFAGISFKTYIFLDTMSSAVELGLFTNNVYNNSISVFVPHLEDRNCGTIGVFVNDNVLTNNKNVKKICYHPKIERVAFSTDYVGEYYKFVNNQLPTVIKNSIDQDFEEIGDREFKIKLKCFNDYPKDDFVINYRFNEKENTLIVFIPVKLLFYIVGDIIYAEYSNNLASKKNLRITSDHIRLVMAQLNSLIRILFLKNSLVAINGKTNIVIQTVLKRNIDEVVKHIVSFIFTYHINRRVKGYYLTHHGDILKELNLKLSPQDIFKFNDIDIDLIRKIDKSFYKEFEIKSSRKKRKIVTYNDDENGKKLRELHKKMALNLQKKYKFSEYSYAYQKGKSVVNCIERHINSVHFLKFDIHKFFNSIDIHRLSKQISNLYQLDKFYEKQLLEILKTCFNDEKMPIGLITSPILSDVFMHDFDVEFASKLNKDYVYTRYADDILISCSHAISQDELDNIILILKIMLNRKGLSLNEKKTANVLLKDKGDYIKYLGLNIVKCEKSNRITVGKKYKNDIAKDYMKYIIMKNGKEKFYFGKKIAGYLSFVKMVEGQEGLNKVYKRIEKNSRGSIIINDKINCL